MTKMNRCEECNVYGIFTKVCEACEKELSDMIIWYKDEIQIGKLQGNKKAVEELKKEMLGFEKLKKEIKRTKRIKTWW